MKLSITFLIFFLMIQVSTAQNNSADISKIIDEVRVKYAPDKRTAVFNVSYIQGEKVAYLSGDTNIPEAKKELLTLLQKSNVEDQIELLPSKELGTKVYGVVNLSVVNVRTKHENSAELATQVLLGSKLKILKSKGEWFLIQCEDDYIGWIDNDGVSLMDKQKFDEWDKAKKISVIVPFVFAYSQENVNSTPVSDVVLGDILKFISKKDGFAKVEYPDGRIAFIPEDQVQDYEEWLNSRHPAYDTILRTANMMMGIPYVWGGTSINGLDCSGFTKIVYQLNGVQLPRDASQQVNVGELVDTQSGFENLLPCDLLFFGTKDHHTGKEKITHVALYLGNSEFIHASGRVRINSLDDTKNNFSEGRFKTFIKAKRILSSLGRNGVKLTYNLNEN